MTSKYFYPASAPKRRRGWGVAGMVIIGVLAFLGLLVSGVIFFKYNEETTKACTVTDKNRTHKTVNGESTLETRVYTAECGTFRVEDAPHKGAFRSGDTYGKLVNGRKYNITYYGWRFGPTSSFPNIIRVSEAQ